VKKLDRFSNWSAPDYTVTAIPELMQTMRKRTCSVLILNWSRNFTVIERNKRTFIGTQELREVYAKLRKTVDTLRVEGEVPEEKIPLIVVLDKI
jgi:hypothetical protein